MGANKILRYSNKSKSLPNIDLYIDNENCYEDKKIADHFNTFVTTVALVLVQKLPPCSQLFSISSEIFKKFYKIRNSKSKVFRLQTMNEEFVSKELGSLNSSKSTGLDNTSARFLKNGAPFFGNCLSYIIDISITCGEVPDELKSARVKPLLKKTCRSEVGNCRPVSILCVVSKTQF